MKRVFDGMKRVFHGMKRVFHGMKRVFHGMNRVFHGMKKLGIVSHEPEVLRCICPQCLVSQSLAMHLTILSAHFDAPIKSYEYS